MFDYLKNLFKADGTTNWKNSLGVMGPLLSGAVMVINTVWGFFNGASTLVTPIDVDSLQVALEQILNAGESIVNALAAATAVVTAIIGRLRAKTDISDGSALKK